MSILVLLRISCATVDHIDPDIKYAGARNDVGADGNPHQMVQGESSSDDVDVQIIQCLEHVRQHDLS
jgi:hypothetical protein